MTKNIPNYITVFRVILVFVFIYLFTSDIENKNLYCVITFFVSGASDVLDGFLARKYKLESDFGKLMDPLADKLMQVTVAICMSTIEPSLIWVPAFLILKELAMVCGAAKLFKKDNIVVQANIFGKLASVVYFLVFLTIMIFNGIHYVVKNLMCLTFVTMSILAFISYINSYSEVYKKN